MNVLFVLVCFPAVIALLLLFAKKDFLRDWIVRISAIIIAGLSIYITQMFFGENATFLGFNGTFVNYGMMAIETALAVYIFSLSIKYKKYLTILLVTVQGTLSIGFEFLKGHSLETEHQIMIDKFTLIMICIIGIIGSLIAVYSLGYMKDFFHHNKDKKDKRNLFFFLIFIFISAMFGLVLSNSLNWLYFFWEITTICSFKLIGYTKTKEAIKNAFKALQMNLIGGLAFIVGIIYVGYTFNTNELDAFLKIGGGAGVMLPVILFALAGCTKAAQMPFSGWLLGAMVAPTPSSALLHSSTMVKAGVYLVLRLSPLLGANPAGYLVTLIGGITFISASFIAITQSDAKKVLAYSTIANLGLVIACGGIGTYEALWAGLLLIIFHAVAKSLMFISVGTVDHKLGSRNIEDMDGLITLKPSLALMMVIGIAGMFLAPFGMLISKWAAMKAFIDSGNLLIIFILVFGSAATLFYWTKWLGKIMATRNYKMKEELEKIYNDEWFSMGAHSFLTILLCMIFPIISVYMLEPYLKNVFGVSNIQIISNGDIIIMLVMIGMLVLLPIGFLALGFGKNRKKVPIYMAGENLGDNLTFRGAMGKPTKVELRNWYMSKYFNEKIINLVSKIICSVLFVLALTVIVGGMIK